MKKRIVIVGGRGLIGSHLVEIGRSGCEVVSVVRPRPQLEPWEVGVDLESDWDRNGSGLPETCDAVVYLAQSNAYRDLPGSANRLFLGNVVSLANLLEYAKGGGAESFVFASTGSVYEDSREEITEASPVISDGSGSRLYPWSKLTGEALVQSYRDHFSTTILRFFFVYGRGGNRQMLLPRIAERVVNGDPVRIQGESGVMLCPTHAGDAARVCLNSTMREGHHLINVAGPESIGLRQIAGIIGDCAGKSPVLESNEGVAPVFRVNIDRMKACLGRDPISFAEGASSLLED